MRRHNRRFWRPPWATPSGGAGCARLGERCASRASAAICASSGFSLPDAGALTLLSPLSKRMRLCSRIISAVVIFSAIFASSRLVSCLVCSTSKLMHRGSDGSASSGKNSGNSGLSLALFAAPCSHARVKPGPSQTNCQVSDSGCVVTVRDTGVASLAPQNTDQRDRPHPRRPPNSQCRLAKSFTWLLIAP